MAQYQVWSHEYACRIERAKRFPKTSAQALSGWTAWLYWHGYAFPLQLELEKIVQLRGLEGVAPADAGNGFDRWSLTVRDGLRESYARHPWLAYGTDWLAFAHIAIAVFFIGSFLDPIRNVWVLQAGVIACFLVVPLALVCGAARQIPWGWRLIDCSFGVIGALPLWYCLRLSRTLKSDSA
jgi:hypothetical protein